MRDWTAVSGNGPVFLFQGQNGFHPGILNEHYKHRSDTKEYFWLVDYIARERLGESFLDFLQRLDRGEVSQNAPANGLDQLGIFLEGYLYALEGRKSGTEPSVMLGHSFGEFAALAAAGVVGFADGLTLVVERVLALRQVASGGGMLVVASDEKSVADQVSQFRADSIEIAVVNHPEQTVVSGRRDELRAFREKLSDQQISAVEIKPPHAFHSQNVRAAVEPFSQAISQIDFKSADVPVYLPVENRLYSEELDMPNLLASHLVKKFDFRAAIETLIGANKRSFYESSGKPMLQRLIERTATAKNCAVEFPAAVSTKKTQSRVPEAKRANAERTADAEPVAVVGFGTVLPGALNSEQYWETLIDGQSKLVKYENLDPHFLTDFYWEGPVQSNKTYSRLCGAVDDADLALAYEKLGLTGGRSKAQMMAAVALSEALSAVGGAKSPKMDMTAFFGATPDGIREYDEALVFEHVSQGLETMVPAADYDEALKHVKSVLCPRGGTSETHHPRFAYRDVFEEVLGRPVKTVGLDSACSSSLYASTRELNSTKSPDVPVACASIY